MNNVLVGEDIILPRSLWSPSHILLSSFLIVGVGALDDPREFRLQIAPPSIAQKRDLQKPSLVREGGPLAVDE